MTAVSETGDRVANRGEFSDLTLDFGDMVERQAFHFRAGAVAIVIERQEIANLLEREAEPPGAIDEAKGLDVFVVVSAGTGWRAARRAR